MTHPSDIAGLSERLRTQVTSDRGCEGRNYSCDCGYDLSTEGLLELAAAALDSLSARVKELEDEPTRLAIRIEKLLCAELGRAWTPSGISVVSLIDELSGRALRADEAYERAAKVAEKFGEPYALNTNTGAMMFRAVTEKIATAIRRLASGPDGGAKP